MERTGAADYLALRTATVANPSLHALAYSLFFVFGSVTSLNDVLMPKLKELFQLNYAEMTLVQFCFFTSYALVSIPAAYLIDSISFVRSVVVGLVLMAAGCLLFLPAAQMHSFSAFLGALFIIAAGVTVVQVSANPLVMALGSSTKTARRLTLAHACNSIGTVVAPYLGSIL
ncbi:MAG: MFS transporter, partial [Steroidobacteraceae bacterium]